MQSKDFLQYLYGSIDVLERPCRTSTDCELGRICFNGKCHLACSLEVGCPLEYLCNNQNVCESIENDVKISTKQNILSQSIERDSLTFYEVITMALLNNANFDRKKPLFEENSVNDLSTLERILNSVATESSLEKSTTSNLVTTTGAQNTQTETIKVPDAGPQTPAEKVVIDCGENCQNILSKLLPALNSMAPEKVTTVKMNKQQVTDKTTIPEDIKNTERSNVEELNVSKKGLVSNVKDESTIIQQQGSDETTSTGDKQNTVVSNTEKIGETMSSKKDMDKKFLTIKTVQDDKTILSNPTKKVSEMTLGEDVAQNIESRGKNEQEFTIVNKVLDLLSDKLIPANKQIERKVKQNPKRKASKKKSSKVKPPGTNIKSKNYVSSIDNEVVDLSTEVLEEDVVNINVQNNKPQKRIKVKNGDQKSRRNKIIDPQKIEDLETEEITILGSNFERENNEKNDIEDTNWIMVPRSMIRRQRKPKNPTEPLVADSTESTKEELTEPSIGGPTELPKAIPAEPPKADPTEPPKADPAELPKADLTEPLKADPTEPPKAIPAEPPKADPTEPPKADPTKPPKVGPTEPPKAISAEPPKADPTEPPKFDPAEPPKADHKEPLKVDPTEPSKVDPTEYTKDDSTEPPKADPTESTKDDPTDPPKADLTEPSTADPTEPPKADPRTLKTVVVEIQPKARSSHPKSNPAETSNSPDNSNTKQITINSSQAETDTSNSNEPDEAAKVQPEKTGNEGGVAGGITYDSSKPFKPSIKWEDSTFIISGGRNEFMINLNTVEKIELKSSCKLTPKILKRMPFAIYDHMSFFVKDKFIFCGGHKRPGVVRNAQIAFCFLFYFYSTLFTF